MTDRKPPAPPPRFEHYRPSHERPEMAQRPDPYQGYPDRPGQPRMPPPRWDPPQYDRGSSWLTGALYGALAVIVLAAAAVAALVMVIPTDAVRDRAIAEVKARTGRDLVIAGPTSFTLYPSVGVSLADVSLSGLPGSGGKPLAKMASLDVSVRLLPLLQRDVRVSRLVLRQPEFNFEVDKEGRENWKFAGLSDAPSATIRFAQADAGTATDAAGGLPSDVSSPSPREGSRSKLEKLEFGDVRIEDGTIRFSDARTGAVREASAVNASLTLPSISHPLGTSGSFNWKGRNVDFNSELTSVKAVLEDRPAKLVLSLTSTAAEAGFDGTVSFTNAFEAEGSFRAKSPSARDLALWLGTVLGPSDGFGPLDAKGMVRATGKTVSFTAAEVTLDGATARGQVAIETSGPRPHVKANLKLSELDLNRYRGALADAGPSASPAPSAPAAQIPQSPAGESAPPASIEDLLNREPAPGPQVKGYVKRDGWSEEPFDLSGLGVVDADAKLSVAKLIIRGIKTGQSELTVTLKNAVMKTNFDDVRLYEGRGTGFVTIDASSSKAANIGGNITLDGIAAQPLLKDAAELDWLAGTGKLAFALAGQGQSERQIVETLNGRAEFTFTDGAIVGVNIPQMVRGFGRPSGDSGGVEKTDFSELASSWVVTAGVAENRDMRLISPLLRMTGSGSVSLPAREIDYMLRPKIVASLSGQGGEQNLSGIEIPVRVHGPLEKPKITPDLGGAFKDPDKAVDTIKEIGKQFKGKSADEIVKGIFGSGDEPPGEEKPAKKLLDQFFNKEKE